MMKSFMSFMMPMDDPEIFNRGISIITLVDIRK